MDELESKLIETINTSPLPLEVKAYVVKTVARTVALTYQAEVLKANIKKGDTNA